MMLSLVILFSIKNQENGGTVGWHHKGLKLKMETRLSQGPYTRKKKNEANIQTSWLNKLGQACSDSQSQGRN